MFCGEELILRFMDDERANSKIKIENIKGLRSGA